MTDVASVSRRERKKLQCKYKILRAARECFRKNGYDETTIANITDAADISYASFFNYFPSKESILLEMKREEYEDLVEELQIEEEKRLPPLKMVELILQQITEDMFLNKNIVFRLGELLNRNITSDALPEVGDILKLHLQRSIESGELNAALEAEDLLAVFLGIMYSSLISGRSQKECEQIILRQLRFYAVSAENV